MKISIFESQKAQEISPKTGPNSSPADSPATWRSAIRAQKPNRSLTPAASPSPHARVASTFAPGPQVLLTRLPREWASSHLGHQASKRKLSPLFCMRQVSLKGSICYFFSQQKLATWHRLTQVSQSKCDTWHSEINFLYLQFYPHAICNKFNCVLVLLPFYK
jgi:hypothetical protein